MNGLTYTTPNGEERNIGKFGKSTQKQFDEALAFLPELIAMSRNGNEKAGYTANELLWHLANESTNTRDIKGFETIFTFGRREA